MNRLEIKWMGRYYDVLDKGEKVGEIYYSINSKQFNFRSESEKVFTLEELKQIINFIERENESNNSYN